MASKDKDEKIESSIIQELKPIGNLNNNNNNNKIAIEIPYNEKENDNKEKINPFDLVESKGIDELDFDIEYSDEKSNNHSRRDSMIDIPAGSTNQEKPIKYFKKKEKGNVSFMKQLLKPRVYLTAVISALTILIATVINGFILSKYTVKSTNEEGIQGWKEKYKVFSYFYIILISPIAEEIVFRRVLYKFFKRFSKLIGYLISCFLYAMAHFGFSFRQLFSEICYFPIYFIIGVILTYTYDYDGYLAASILSNMLYSSLILLFDIID